MNFDLTEVKDEFELLPEGTYPAYVDKAEWKTSKAGADYLNIMFKTINENRVVFNMYNLTHPTDKARNIALSDLKKLFLASGKPEDSMKALSKEGIVALALQCRCQIVVGKRTDDWGEKNIVKGYKPMKKEVDTDSIPFY